MIGELIAGRYRITEKIGAGAMATVYKAQDTETGQIVAVKQLHEDLSIKPQYVERFRRESEVLAGLNHPNIVDFIEAVEEAGTYFIVMEYVDGGSLADRMKEGPLPVKRARRIAIQVCDALTSAHDRGVIHRDIKPANILLTEEGEVKISDFGVARMVDRTRLTRTGSAVGAPAYMAPETWEGKVPDAKADIYSLGVTLYQMLAGELPFKAATPEAMMRKHLEQQAEPLRSVREDVPSWLERIVDQAMDKDKARRYQTARQFSAALEHAPARPPKRIWERIVEITGPRLPSRGTLAVVSGVLGLALVLIGGGLWVVGAPTPTPVRSTSLSPPHTPTQELGTEMDILRNMELLGSPDEETRNSAREALKQKEPDIENQTKKEIIQHTLKISDFGEDLNSRITALESLRGDLAKDSFSVNAIPALARTLDIMNTGIAVESKDRTYVDTLSTIRSIGINHPPETVEKLVSTGLLEENGPKTLADVAVLINSIGANVSEDDKQQILSVLEEFKENESIDTRYLNGSLKFLSMTPTPRPTETETPEATRTPTPTPPGGKAGEEELKAKMESLIDMQSGDINESIREDLEKVDLESIENENLRTVLKNVLDFIGPNNSDSEKENALVQIYELANTKEAVNAVPALMTGFKIRAPMIYNDVITTLIEIGKNSPEAVVNNLIQKGLNNSDNVVYRDSGQAIILIGRNVSDDEKTLIYDLLTESGAPGAKDIAENIMTSTATPTFTPRIPLTPTPLFTATSTPSPPPVSAGTPVPRPAAAISAANADRVSPLARWGKGWVGEVAFSPDGELLAVASSIGIYLYDAGTLEEKSLIEADSWVTSVAFSPDGATIASGSDDETVRLWRVSDGVLTRTLEGHTGYVSSVAFSPDGATIASGSGTPLLLNVGSPDNTVRLWRVSDGALLRTLEGHTGNVNSVAFSPDGETIASGSGDGTIRLWGVK